MTAAPAITVAAVRAAVCLSSDGEYSLLITTAAEPLVQLQIAIPDTAAWALTARSRLPINAEPMEETT